MEEPTTHESLLPPLRRTPRPPPIHLPPLRPHQDCPPMSIKEAEEVQRALTGVGLVVEDGQAILSIPSPDSLTALFLADPLTLTDTHLTTLVREFRRRRNEFLAQEAANAAKGKKAKVARTPADPAILDKPLTEIDLADLGVE